VTPRPVPAGRPRFEIADVVRAHRAELEVAHRLSVQQRRVLSAIALCRTAALGGYIDVCRSCGYEHPAYNSCRNRHCPKCQAFEQERWIGARAARLLPVGHFHVVFTMPAELRPLARYTPRRVYDALFGAVSATLLELGRSRLGATLGVTMVLHTWTRELTFHPHVHAIVTAGGLAVDGSAWLPQLKYLLPVEMIGTVIRGKMLDALRRLHARGALADFDEFRDPEAFDRLMARLANASWVVYAKKPFRRPDHVLAYLGRYTHRVGIANSRIVDVTDTAVTFRTKNGNAITLDPIEFLRRFLLHVLPEGFKKIRHTGLYAGAHVRSLLPRARGLLGSNRATANVLLPRSPLSWSDRLHDLTGRDVDRCPICGGGVEHVPVARAPPGGIAA
jgi:hypothetical protein